MKRTNFGVLTKKFPNLADPQGFSTDVLKKYGLTKNDLKKANGFICLGLVRTVKPGIEPKMATLQWWIYDEDLFKLGRAGHRNPAKYQKLFMEALAKLPALEKAYAKTKGKQEQGTEAPTGDIEGEKTDE